MNSYSITKIFILSTMLLFFLQSNSFAQTDFSIGGYLGGGVISGFATGQGSFTSSIFVEGNAGLIEDINFRLSFFYARDFNSLLGERQRYFPFSKGFTLKGIISQNVSERLFLEEGIGLLTINDRTFSNVNEWNFGVVFSLLGGIDFRKEFLNGFRTGVGIEYGLTFHNTFAKYFSLHLQTQYVF